MLTFSVKRTLTCFILSAFYMSLSPALASKKHYLEMESKLLLLEQEYLENGGSKKALDQMRCFIKKNFETKFPLPKVTGDLAFRCNLNTVQITNWSAFGLIDYTQDSNRKRFFIFDFKNNKLLRYAVSHGRYGETLRTNQKLSSTPKQNSVMKAIFFSNVEGLNATSGGFHITSNEYPGQYGRSLVLHGVDSGINDNACKRAVVIHPSVNVGVDQAYVMSSGCPMVNPSVIDSVVEKLKGGAVLYHFTPDQKINQNTECPQ